MSIVVKDLYIKIRGLLLPRSSYCALTGDRGFTIIEILVVVGLIALFTTILIGIYRGASSGQMRVSEDLQMQSRILGIQNEVLRLVREGQYFVVPRLGENSSVLCFVDKVSDIQALVPIKDEKLSEKFGKPLYQLMHYRVNIENFDPASPSFEDAKGRVIAEFLEKISFRPSNAGALGVNALFSTETRQFQIVFEGGLMNAGDPE